MNGTNNEVSHCGAFSTPHSHPSWAQIFASGPCFQIPLAWIPPLMQETMFQNHIAQLAILLFYIYSLGAIIIYKHKTHIYYFVL